MKIWAFFNPGIGKPGRKFLVFIFLVCTLAFTFTEAQTIAEQRLLPVGVPHGVAAASYARWMTLLMKILRRIRVFD